MEKKRKIELEILNALKEKKMSEVFGDKGKKKKKNLRKKQKNRINLMKALLFKSENAEQKVL